MTGHVPYGIICLRWGPEEHRSSLQSYLGYIKDALLLYVTDGSHLYYVSLNSFLLPLYCILLGVIRHEVKGLRGQQQDCLPLGFLFL